MVRADRSQDVPQKTKVLIIGGGPAGLSAAVELGRRGVPCLIVEPRLVVSRLRPRAKTTNVRTMEHFRRWGLAERIREVAPLKVGWSQDVVFIARKGYPYHGQSEPDRSHEMTSSSSFVLYFCYGKFMGTVAHGFYCAENTTTTRVYFLHSTSRTTR